jgi:hypothetical protein
MTIIGRTNPRGEEPVSDGPILVPNPEPKGPASVNWTEWRVRAGVPPLASPPEGMVVVSQETFFRMLSTAAGDPMPRPEKYHTVWETRSRALWGWSAPGWMDGGLPDPRRVYAVVRQ